MLLNVQQPFGPNDFIRQLQAAETPIRNNVVYVAEEDFKIRKDIADFRTKLNGQLMNEVIHYRQDNTQLRIILGNQEQSTQHIINNLQSHIDAEIVENDRLRSQLQRASKDHDSKIVEPCPSCIKLQLKLTSLQQQLQIQTDNMQELSAQLAQSQKDVRKLQKENSLLNRKVSQLKEKQIRNIEEYNQLMQSYTNLNSDNEMILLQFDKVSRRQIEKEEELKEFTTRIEDINGYLKGEASRPLEKLSILKLDNIVVEVEKRIQELQTRFEEKTIETEQLSTKLSEKEAFYRRVSDQYTEAIEKMELYQKVENAYKQKIQELKREGNVQGRGQSVASPVNEELIENIQHLDNLLVRETQKNHDLALELNRKDQQINSLHAKLEEMEGSIKNALRTLEQKERVIKRLQDENDGLQARIRDMLLNEESNSREQQGLKKKIAELNDEIVSLDANEAVLKKQIQMLERSLSEEKLVSEQREQVSLQLRDSLANADECIISLREQIARMTQGLNQAFQQITDIQNQRQEDLIARKIDEANWQREAQEMDARINQIQQQNQQLRKLIEELNEKLANMDVYICSKQKMFREETDLLDRQRTEERKVFEQKLAHSLQREVQNKHEAEFFKKKLQEAEDYISELQKENDTVKEAVEQLKDRVAPLSVEVAGLNDKLVVTALDNELLVRELDELREENERQGESHREHTLTMQQTIDKLQLDLKNAVKLLNKEARWETAAGIRMENTMVVAG